jgi:hypothetical protein
MVDGEREELDLFEEVLDNWVRSAMHFAKEHGCSNGLMQGNIENQKWEYRRRLEKAMDQVREDLCVAYTGRAA